MSNYSDTLASLKAETVFSLARGADVACPDSIESPGALFLTRVRDAMLERAEETYADADSAAYFERIADFAPEVADDMVPIYTHQRWQVFVDLAAYQVDIEELAGDSGTVDMTELAGLALFEVARNLGDSLLEELQAAIDADEDEEAETTL